VPEKDDQLILQDIGGMTDRQYAAFNAFLAQVSGCSVREKKNTLAKMTEGRMPGFTVRRVPVGI